MPDREPTHLSKEAHQRLQAERDDLVTRGRIEISQAIEAARALGDLSENGDYHAAKDAQGKMESRIRQLEAMLFDAIVVDATSSSSDVVIAGSIVCIRYDGDDDIERCLVGSIEERVEGTTVVSPASPLGKALLGKSQGEIVTYEAPGGILKVEIVTIGD
ncbi:MAG TPA: transcription elongation factor GreA [Acidimicrobiales bacterium]|nr:transcription elongation factor GreA [Acidimicrobiales bacterium]